MTIPETLDIALVPSPIFKTLATKLQQQSPVLPMCTSLVCVLSSRNAPRVELGIKLIYNMSPIFFMFIHLALSSLLAQWSPAQLKM